ncbi:hypothetical protein F443_02885 [Phytophthora nicotianae P1569]|uniref:Uncharacterized protein n=1 Tax=Phytophthora nicotianae P1569 TaxID=1317065 RepID=V9FS18_PHYNI|nr:hypothetical protein F443_02885 [Phytophthora nicotianae P1569]
MAPEIWEAPLDPEAEAEAEALASAVVEDSVALDDSVAESSEPTAADPAVLVASAVPLDAMFMLLSMPDAAVDVVAAVSAAAEEAVEVAADVVAAAAEAAVEVAADVWPLTAATARAAMTRNWKTFILVVGRSGDLDT